MKNKNILSNYYCLLMMCQESQFREQFQEEFDDLMKSHKFITLYLYFHIMSLNKAWKSQHYLHNNLSIPLLNLQKQQEILKNGRLNYTQSHIQKNVEQEDSKRGPLNKFRGNELQFKREKSLYRQMVSRNNSMKLLKQQNMSFLQLRSINNEPKNVKDDTLSIQDHRSQDISSKTSQSGSQQNLERRFKRKNIVNKTIQNDEPSKKHKLIIKPNMNNDKPSNDFTLSTTNKKQIQSLQAKSQHNYIKDQISNHHQHQQQIINQKNIHINKLQSTISELKGQIVRLNQIIHVKQQQNKLINSQYEYLRHHFSKIINDFQQPKKISGNLYGQQVMIECQIRQIQDQIMNLRNGIKYLEIQNLTLKKVRTEVEIQKQAVLKLQENKRHLEKNIALLKEINLKKSKMIQQFVKQKNRPQRNMKRAKTQLLQSLFSDNSDNSLDLSLEDQKPRSHQEDRSIQQQSFTQNFNFIKLLTSSSKYSPRNFQKIIQV